MKKIFLVITTVFLFLLQKEVFAYSFELIAPDGVLQRGQEVVFTIRIDPQGESLTNVSIGLSYNTEYLEFLNAIPGDTFDSIVSQEIETGKLVLTGTNSTPVTEEGIFAKVQFKLIAEAPGTTELCSFFNPETTPTPEPEEPTPTPTPTPIPQTYSTPTPTPPVSGNFEETNVGLFLGTSLLIAGIIAFFIKRNIY